MKDKLIIIAVMQFIIENSKELLIDSGRSKPSQEKAGVIKALNITLMEFHHAITGNMWQKSPKELHEWCIQYMKDEVDKIEGRAQVTLN